MGVPQDAQAGALVSFTNVACDEIHQRCRAAGYPDLLAFPNFVGTIDTFIWRYLVRPFIPQDRHRHRIDSWDRINATITVRGSREYRIRLSDFQFHRGSPGGDCEARLQRTTRNYAMVKALELESLIRRAEEAAVEARDNFGKQGYVTGHEIRILTLHALRSHGRTMAAMLRGRFDELIVDEAQDCSNLDLAILGQLRDAGLPLVFVCDPDQAIYEFRGARPREVRAFGATLGTRIDLTGNWRSSSAVCGLAASLRPADSDREVDDPIGAHHGEPAGILLLRTKKTDVERALAIFTTYADRMGIPIESRLVLAHAGGKLPKKAASASGPPSAADPVRIAWAACILAVPHHTRRQRERAYEMLERALLRYWYAGTDGRSVAAICDELGIEKTALRAAAARLASALPDVDEGTFGHWCAEANKALKCHPPQPGIAREGQEGILRATGKAREGTARQAGGVSTDAEGGLRASVIHQVKGEETDAVLVIVPSDARTDALVDAWVSGEHHPHIAESLRVLYVAATRARRLLAFALPDEPCDRIADLLKNKGIPVDLEHSGR